MNGILFIDFNLVACDFLKCDWCKMLNGYVGFSFNIFSLRMTVVSIETLENWRWFKKTWIMSISCIFCNLNNDLNVHLLILWKNFEHSNDQEVSEWDFRKKYHNSDRSHFYLVVILFGCLVWLMNFIIISPCLWKLIFFC